MWLTPDFQSDYGAVADLRRYDMFRLIVVVGKRVGMMG